MDAIRLSCQGIPIGFVPPTKVRKYLDEDENEEEDEGKEKDEEQNEDEEEGKLDDDEQGDTTAHVGEVARKKHQRRLAFGPSSALARERGRKNNRERGPERARISSSGAEHESGDDAGGGGGSTLTGPLSRIPSISVTRTTSCWAFLPRAPGQNAQPNSSGLPDQVSENQDTEWMGLVFHALRKKPFFSYFFFYFPLGRRGVSPQHRSPMPRFSFFDFVGVGVVTIRMLILPRP